MKDTLDSNVLAWAYLVYLLYVMYLDLSCIIDLLYTSSDYLSFCSSYEFFVSQYFRDLKPFFTIIYWIVYVWYNVQCNEQNVLFIMHYKQYFKTND